MALTGPQVLDAWHRWVAQLGQAPCQLSVTDLQAAVTAVDTWCTNNSASFNTALPDPFKSIATAGQKAALLAIVAVNRYGNNV